MFCKLSFKLSGSRSDSGSGTRSLVLVARESGPVRTRFFVGERVGRGNPGSSSRSVCFLWGKGVVRVQVGLGFVMEHIHCPCARRRML